MLLVVPMLAIFCYGVYTGDDSCRGKSSGALFVRVGDISTGSIVRWVDVEDDVKVMVVRA